jgi:hypothetical protein
VEVKALGEASAVPNAKVRATPPTPKNRVIRRAWTIAFTFAVLLSEGAMVLIPGNKENQSG